jgi:hypothetical protein
MGDLLRPGSGTDGGDAPAGRPDRAPEQPALEQPPPGQPGGEQPGGEQPPGGQPPGGQPPPGDDGDRESQPRLEPRKRSRAADADWAANDQAEQLFSGGDRPCEGDGTREMLETVYVEPGGYQTARQALETNHVVVLTGRGKQATGRHLLYACGVDQIEEIDPFIDPAALVERRFVGSRGYQVDNLADERAKWLRGYHLRLLKDVLGSESYLVITVSDPAALPEREDGQVVTCQVPDLQLVLGRHLEWCLRNRGGLGAGEMACLEAEEVRRFLARDHRPFQAVRLARALAADPGQDLCARLTTVLADLDDPAHQVARCLGASNDHRHWSYVLSLAVLNGQDRHLVADAADRLARCLVPEDPDAESGWNPGPARTERLGLAMAEEVDDQEITVDLGAVPIRRVRFKDSSMPNHVLDHVWIGYDELRGPICAWLEDLAGDDDPRLRASAAVTVGYLSRHGFRWMLNRLLVPWTRDGYAKREAAAVALGARATERQFTGQVLALLHSWAGSDDTDLQVTAALAHGRLAGPDPRAALHDLREIARRAGHLGTQVAESVADLVWFKGAATVLPELEKWTGDKPDEPLASTGRLAFLWAANLFEEPGYPRVGEWPVLLRQAEDNEGLQETMAELWRRVLAHPDSDDLAAEAICRWAHAADLETALCGNEQSRLTPLLRRQLKLVLHPREPGHAGRLRSVLNDCAHDRDDPSRTAEEIAGQIR